MVSNRIKQIDSVWAGLLEEETGVMRKLPGLELPFYLMASSDTKSILYAFPKNKKVDFKIKEYENIEVKIVSLSSELKAISVALNNNRLYSIFLNITSNIVNSLFSCGDNDDLGLKIFVQKINQWRSIFNKKYEKILTPEQQLGLYGELTLLRGLIQNGFELSDALSAWIGPLKDDKDFIFQQKAVEVKSTSKMDKLIKISNIRQLDTVGFEDVVLYHYSFVRSASGKNTLPALVKQLRDVFSVSSCPEEFEEKLVFAGYFDKDEENYVTNYSLNNEDCYKVCAGFPRLTHDNVMDNILNVSYIIDLNSADQYLISFQQFLEIIK